jgi:hypothetical protein
MQSITEIVSDARLEDVIDIALGTVLRDQETLVEYVYIGRIKNTVGYTYHFTPDVEAYGSHSMTATFAKLGAALKKFPGLQEFIVEKRMPEPMALNQIQRDTLRKELERDDLSIYTAVRMARHDVEVGHFDAAISRLRFEMDKLRMHSPEICDLIRVQYPK